jgi:DNA-binding transcriptional LysR family regulator
VRLNFNHIMVFLDVAESGSINAAAQSRHVAQSAVSRIVRELESALGMKLLRRHAWGVELTESGGVLVNLARSIRAEATAARRELALLGEHAHAISLSVGAHPTVAAFVLPEAIKRMSERLPTCRITVREGLKETLLPALSSGALDVVACRIGNMELPAGLSERLIYHDAMAILAGRHYRAPSRKKITAEDLKDGSWILPPPDAEPYQDVIATFQSLRIPVPKPKVQSAAIELIRTLLHSDQNWLAMVPRDLFRMDLEAKRIKMLGNAPQALWRPMGLILRSRASGEERQVAAFIDCFTEAARDLPKPPQSG